MKRPWHDTVVLELAAGYGLFILLALAFLLLSECVTTPAHAQIYLEGAGGLALGQAYDHAYDFNDAPVSPHGMNRPTVPGGVLAVRAGAYSGIWGLEVEAMHAQPNVKQDFIHSCDQQPDGTCINPRRSLMAGRMLSVNSVALHGLLRYQGHDWEPFIGIGPALLMSKLGGDACGWKPPQCGTVISPYTDSTRKAMTLGLSAKVGTVYKLTDRWGLTLTYQFHYGRFAYDGWVPQADAAGHAETIGYTMQMATVGIRYAFN